jgi:hypothetical protein
MAYEASAELARKQYELAKGRAESARDLRLGTIGRNYLQGARSLEAGMEGRGILRSGEAMRRRVEYGAEEKAAREAAMQQGEYDVNQAALDYASELARLQALGYSGATATPEPEKPKEPEPVRAAPPATAPATGGGGGGGAAPATPAPSTQCPPGYAWDPIKNACVLIESLPTVDGKTVMPGDTPSETRGVPPTVIPIPTSGGTPIRGGDTPSESRGVAPIVVRPTTPSQSTIGGVTLPNSVWQDAFARLAAAAPRPAPAPVPVVRVTAPGGLRRE